MSNCLALLVFGTRSTFYLSQENKGTYIASLKYEL
jgi:hypothetical protein